MQSSWTVYIRECKSRLSAIARLCFLGRLHWRKKFEELGQSLDELQAELESQNACIEQLEQEKQQLLEENAALKAERDKPQPLQLPLGEPCTGQQYGVGLITLAVNLARIIGLRPAENAMTIVFDWLSADVEVPARNSIRIWMQRLGCYRMTSAKKESGGTWLVDHTVQIGKEKVLAVLRVTDSHMKPDRLPLGHNDVGVLALVPGEEWKRENVKEAYEEIAQRYGTPRAVLTDGAVELREPAETLGKQGKRPLVNRDTKHFLANQFEALLKKDPRYETFAQRLAGTRSAVQQTELAHFAAPVFKIKARFMNFEPTLIWASTILWHLDHPNSKSRDGITAKRLNEKLGWLRELAKDIDRWQVCQEVISIALKFINQNGIYRGASRKFDKLVAKLQHNPLSKELVTMTKAYLKNHEKQLKKGERLPMSTEILESGFARYKQFEQQHSKSGFTSLLLTFPTLLKKTTPTEVRAALTTVKVKDVQAWIKKYLPNTLASKRTLMYREARASTKAKTSKSAMPMVAAA